MEDTTTATARRTVTFRDTAIAVGSGDVPVLATPRLLAWMEAVTIQASAPFTAAGETTVGTTVHLEHRRPTPIGATIDITAAPTGETGAARPTFTVRATDHSGRLVATGEITRAVVDRARFAKRSRIE